MGIWVDILNKAADGDSAAARTMLWHDLPLKLVNYPASSSGSLRYTGLLADRLRNHIRRLSGAEHSLAKLYEQDLTDYIIETVIGKIEQTIRLVELCLRNPDGSITDLAASFPWPHGLNRSYEWKEERIVDWIRSMLEIGINLPAATRLSLGDRGSPGFSFNEAHFAVSTKLIHQCWLDFKERYLLNASVTWISDPESDGVAEESVDYGGVNINKLSLSNDPRRFQDVLIDFRRAKERIETGLNDTLQEMHQSAPSDGYKPIAWHRAFWELDEEYENLDLSLKTENPFCETDQTLADHIAVNFQEVKSPSRLNLFRRRTRLQNACQQLIQENLATIRS